MARWRFRLLDSGLGDPAWNMAVDEVLLRGAAERPTLRLYAWDPPALSLGYHQRIDDYRSHRLPPSCSCSCACSSQTSRPPHEHESDHAPPTPRLVRRLTGGGAILHDAREVTYAVAAPLEFFGRPLRESYVRVMTAVRDALAGLGIDVEFAGAEFAELAGVERAADAFLCFERRAAFDLVDPAGRKVAGSAQRRDGRRILQHGSVRGEPYGALAAALAASFASRLEADLVPGPLLPEERSAARALAAERYATEAWTALR